MRAHADRGLFGWFVFLGDAGPEAESRLDENAYTFARANDAATIPISALGEPDGPPGYLIPASAQVTVLLFRQRKVLSHRSYTAGEWTLAASRAALAELPRLIATAPRVRSAASPTPAAGPAIGPVDSR